LKLVPGVEGVTVGRHGEWSRGSDRFVGVRFQEIGTFDILWESLEIIDAEYLAEAAERERKTRELLKNAKSVVRIVGPRGGFRYLSYEYVNEHGIPCHVSNGDRNAADNLVKYFLEQGIEVREEKET